jgi:hypothetical protein
VWRISINVLGNREVHGDAGMTASKGPTLLIAHLRRAAEKRHPTDERVSIFTQAADCLEAQADKISRQREEIEMLRERLQRKNGYVRT